MFSRCPPSPRDLLEVFGVPLVPHVASRPAIQALLGEGRQSRDKKTRTVSLWTSKLLKSLQNEQAGSKCVRGNTHFTTHALVHLRPIKSFCNSQTEHDTEVLTSIDFSHRVAEGSRSSWLKTLGIHITHCLILLKYFAESHVNIRVVESEWGENV